MATPPPRPPVYTQYTEAENELLRAEFRRVMDAHGWNRATAAAQLGLAPQTVSHFLNGRIRAGKAIVRALEQATGRPEAQLLGRVATDREFREIPGWDQAVALAMIDTKNFGHITPEVWHAIGSWRGAKPPPLDPQVLGSMALMLQNSWSHEDVNLAFRERMETVRAARAKAAAEAESEAAAFDEPTKVSVRPPPATTSGAYNRQAAGPETTTPSKSPPGRTKHG
jgi:transcriptional regulator with XRE-family HTH domain